MATVNGTLSKPLEAASIAIRKAAAAQGWSLAEGDSAPPAALVFKKGLTVFSWGSRLRVRLSPRSVAETEVTIRTAERYAFTSWGRGKRAAQKLLAQAGAHTTP
ncbi:hypothetical protein ACSMXN_05685 [Jatrophihabitans sp. DSM 45814]